MVDKNYCMSSYLAYRYIIDDEKNFYENTYHENYKIRKKEQQIQVESASDIDMAIKKQVETLERENLGILLSGGMDSAILASYMPGCEAYTFRFEDGKWQKEELERAEAYAEYYGLHLHYVDISWYSIEPYIDIVMKKKGAPVHSIEPQLALAALQAKADGVKRIVIGNAADYIFGGMDKLLSKDWEFDEFVKRYMYLNPADILVDAVDVTNVFEDYREGNNINFVSFMSKYAVIESYGSYQNAFKTASMPYIDLYEIFTMRKPLNLSRIRKGESKYLIRELFQMKYPQLSIPEKNPMPRPVDIYFKNWKGPVRREFKKDLDIDKFSGNQKWQIYCLERFLDLYEK